MKSFLTLSATVLLAVSLMPPATAQADEPTGSQYPTYRSPNQKQADYTRSQATRRYVAPTVTVPTYGYHYGYGYPRYGVGYRYPYNSYYGVYGRPVYPVYQYYPPVYRTWPVTPYPFRVP